MFDVSTPAYDEAAFFEGEDAIVAHQPGLAGGITARMLIDPRLALSIVAVALAASLPPLAALVAILAAFALTLGITLRPSWGEGHGGHGAFSAVELGFLIWSSDLRAAFGPSGCQRASGAFAVFTVAIAATLAAGLYGEPKQVAIAGAMAMMSLGVLRLALAAMVRVRSAG